MVSCQNSMEGALNQGMGIGMTMGLAAITESSGKEGRGALWCRRMSRRMRAPGTGAPEGLCLAWPHS